MNQEKTNNSVIVKPLDRQSRLLDTLKKRAYAALVLSEEATAEAKGSMSAYKELAASQMYLKLGSLNLHCHGDRFFIHEGPYAGEYIFQERIVVDENFDWRVVTEKIEMTSKGKPSKVTKTMNFMADYLSSHASNQPLKTVGASKPVAIEKQAKI